jgi:hypothetical protein
MPYLKHVHGQALSFKPSACAGRELGCRRDAAALVAVASYLINALA